MFCSYPHLHQLTHYLWFDWGLHINRTHIRNATWFSPAPQNLPMKFSVVKFYRTIQMPAFRHKHEPPDWSTTLLCPHTSLPRARRETGLWLQENPWSVYRKRLIIKRGRWGWQWQGDLLSYVPLNHRAELFGTYRTHVQRPVYSTPNKSAHLTQRIR